MMMMTIFVALSDNGIKSENDTYASAATAPIIMKVNNDGNNDKDDHDDDCGDDGYIDDGRGDSFAIENRTCGCGF